MTTYYISKSGSDANNGLGPDASHATNKPWLTIGKALLAGGLATGDTVYIHGGSYRETILVGISPTTETKVYGDPGNTQGFKDSGGVLLSPEYVIWSSYTTNDKTVPAATAPLRLNAKDFFTFQDIIFVGGDTGNSCVDASVSVSTDITFRRCCMFPGRNGQAFQATNGGTTGNTPFNWMIDSCILLSGMGSHTAGITFATNTTGADWDLNFQIKNSLLWCLNTGAGCCIRIFGSAANAFKAGGIDVYNCTIMGGLNGVQADANHSATVTSTFYNNLFFFANTCLLTTATTHFVEDYNWLAGNTARANVNVGANSQTFGTAGVFAYAMLPEVGQSFLYGFSPRPFMEPMLKSPWLGFGNQASSPTVDALGRPRPSGPGPTWTNALPGIGWLERGNTGTREVTTVRTGSNALKLLGPASQDFDLPVNSASTTVTVYGRYDGTYAGTKPQMIVRNGEENGVATATATMAGAADTWEQLSLNFTPTTAGIVTIRLQSNSTAGGGAAFFDDFAVS